jgi:hypothetical protein
MRTDRHTNRWADIDVTKLTVGFRNFAKAPNKNVLVGGGTNRLRVMSNWLILSYNKTNEKH